MTRGCSFFASARNTLYVNPYDILNFKLIIVHGYVFVDATMFDHIDIIQTVFTESAQFLRLEFQTRNFTCAIFNWVMDHKKDPQHLRIYFYSTTLNQDPQGDYEI